ncbi:MAG: cytochrome b/b6 domain-containing protein [Thermodesulfobacteriota bacterium]
MKKETLLRHPLTVRLCHWSIAISGILLLFSGFGQMPMYKRYNIVKIPGLAWADQYALTLAIHYVTAAIFTAAVVYHLIYHLRRHEFAIMPRRGDVAESIQSVKAMFRLATMPRHEKFQAKQRLAYGVIGISSLLLIVTGLIKSYKNLGNIVLEPLFLQAMTMLHTLFGMIFMALFLAHVGALLLKEHRPLVPSMFSGRIAKEYVDEHLPGWSGDS